MTAECPSLLRFASFHDSCARRIESDPVRFNPQLLEFAAARLRELIGSSDLAMRIRSWDLEKIVMDDRIKQMMELGRGTTMGELFEGRPGCEFFELHYHGELVFSRNVQSIDLMPWGEEPPDKGLLDRIRAMGVAVRMPCNEREGLGSERLVEAGA